jgi:hypothetical protein
MSNAKWCDKTIDRFLRKHSKIDNIKIKHYKKPKENLMGFIDVDKRGENVIHINTSHVSLKRNKINDLWMRSFLLHEVGHLHSKNPDNEYQVQKWAINRAIDSKMYAVAEILICEIEAWRHLTIHNKIYQQAYCRAEKTGFLRRARKKLEWKRHGAKKSAEYG